MDFKKVFVELIVFCIGLFLTAYLSMYVGYWILVAQYGHGSASAWFGTASLYGGGVAMLIGVVFYFLFYPLFGLITRDWLQLQPESFGWLWLFGKSLLSIFLCSLVGVFLAVILVWLVRTF